MRKFLLLLCATGLLNRSYEQVLYKNFEPSHALSSTSTRLQPDLNSINRNFDIGQKQAPAQSKLLSKLFLKAYTGFGFVSPGSFRIQSTSAIVTYDPGGGRTITVVETESAKGIGRGIKFGGGIGYAMNDFLNIGIDVEYQKGQKITNDLGSNGGQFSYDSTFSEMHCNVASITPHILFKALAKPRFFIYNKLGAVFTLPFTLHKSGYGRTSDNYTWPPGPLDSSSANLYTHNYSSTNKYKVSLGIGFNVAFGINFKLSSRLRLFTELFGNFSALKPKSSISTFEEINSNLYFLPQYDNNPDPPVLLGYSPASIIGLNHISERTKYYKNGAITNQTTIVEASPYPNSEYYITSNGTSDRFIINLNSIGIHCGFLLRF